jgi:YVTN family beta-propeller protein
VAGRTGTLSVVDAATDRIAAVVPVGKRPWGVAVSTDGRFIYTANGLSNDVTVVDASTNRVLGRIPVGQRPWGIALSK